MNLKFYLQKYFNMKIIFNDLDWPLELLNSRYEYEAREILYFMKHHKLTLYELYRLKLIYS
jgi:hypothetical protein